METLTAQIQTPKMHVWALRSTNSPEHARHSLAYQRFVKVGEGGSEIFSPILSTDRGFLGTLFENLTKWAQVGVGPLGFSHGSACVTT